MFHFLTNFLRVSLAVVETTLQTSIRTISENVSLIGFVVSELFTYTQTNFEFYVERYSDI